MEHKETLSSLLSETYHNDVKPHCQSKKLLLIKRNESRMKGPLSKCFQLKSGPNTRKILGNDTLTESKHFCILFYDSTFSFLPLMRTWGKGCG